MRTFTNPVTADLDAGLPAAAATLRALASRHGITLGAVGRMEEAAAVLAAELWCGAVRAGTLDYPIAHGEGAVKVLAAILARAAGHGRRVEGSARLSEDLDLVRSWELITEGFPPEQAQRIEAVAAHDLLQGTDDRLTSLVRR